MSCRWLFRKQNWFSFALLFMRCFVSFCRAHVLVEFFCLFGMRVTVHATLPVWMRYSNSHATPFRGTCWPAACYPENTEQIQDSASNALNRIPASGEVSWMVSNALALVLSRETTIVIILRDWNSQKTITSPSSLRGPKRVESYSFVEGAAWVRSVIELIWNRPGFRSMT